jgi:hypothetical protein
MQAESESGSLKRLPDSDSACMRGQGAIRT